jgi:alpha-beta hydrolase superfamily lysophospholipase
VYFGAASRPLLGWLHRPPTEVPARDVAVVLCAPFGYEALCAHRSLRHFAERAASLGVSAFRFDYDGTGDSAGDDLDPDRWTAWVESTRHAIDAARQHTGARQVVLLGVRLGVTIAATAAMGRGDVAGLAAIAPVLAGKPWLREQRALQAALGLQAPPEEYAPSVEMQESVGFAISDATRDVLLTVDLMQADAAPAAQVLILDREDRPPSDAWSARLRAQGAEVVAQRLPGYLEMMFDPHNAVPPSALLDAFGTWLAGRSSDAARSAAHARVSTPAVARWAGVEESVVFLDPERRTIGVVTRPVTAARTGVGVLLINSGAIHHVGPNRLYVALARRWAARGAVVMRIDLAGIGESLPWPGAPENVVYTPTHLREVASAIAHLRDREGVSSVRATGICSGAYHAFKSAVAGAGLDVVVPVNPLVFFWKDGMSLDYPSHLVVEAAAQYKRSMFQMEKWKKLLTGGVDFRAIAAVAGRHGASVAAGWSRNVGRSVGLALTDDVGTELRAATRQGTRVRFVFADGEPGEALLRTGAGWALRPLEAAGQVRVSMLHGPDHTFSARWAQEALARILDAELEIGTETRGSKT